MVHELRPHLPDTQTSHLVRIFFARHMSAYRIAWLHCRPPDPSLTLNRRIFHDAAQTHGTAQTFAGPAQGIDIHCIFIQ